MKNVVIGISGKAGAGKDTIASMLNYILSKGVTRARYSEWVIKQHAYDKHYSYRIIHFADVLKDCCSLLFGIKREYLDDRYYKDESWFHIKGHKFIKEEDSYNNIYTKIEIEQLKKYNLNYYISNIKNVIIKVRTLLQYFGTDICRDNLYNNIFVDATMAKAASIAESCFYCIISDVRFENEEKVIHNNSLKGKIILVNKNDTKNINHISETSNIKYDVLIDNNSSLVSLYYKVVNFVQEHLLD